MIVTQIGNACCEYSSEGYKLLSDPWLIDGAFEGSWFHYPTLKTKVDDFKDIDALYLSHLHPDHFDENTLKDLPKGIAVIYLDEAPNYLERKIAGLGFKNLHPLKDLQKKEFGPFTVHMHKPFIGNLFHESEIGNLIDSAIVIQDGEFQILNANDNAPTIEWSKKIYHLYGPMDVVQLVDSCAGPYPACFSNLNHEEKLSERKRILQRHLSLMIECAKIMRADYFQPFAGHYQLGGALMKLNPYLAVHEIQQVAEIVRRGGLKSIPLFEGDSFDLKTKRIKRAAAIPPQLEWEEVYARSPYSYEALECPEDKKTIVDALMKALENLKKKQEQLNCYPNWEIRFENPPFGFSLSKEENCQKGIIKFTMDLRALWAILHRKIHWNNLEVGCHIEIHREPNVYNPDIHLLMCFFHL